MRGEYICAIFARTISAELPPHARRIRGHPESVRKIFGTTSACAENTARNRRFSSRFWNYLRMRGEYLVQGFDSLDFLELPPHARRIQAEMQRFDEQHGTTSACAENTMPSSDGHGSGWNYLRMRGEYGQIGFFPRRGWELPPHARRIHTLHYTHPTPPGTTSACAENTVL